MRNQLRAAIIVEIVVLIVAFGFSIMYVMLGWYRSSHVLDVLLVVLWVLVAAALLLVFRSRSLTREEMIRRFYLSRDWVYNHEIGYAPFSQIVPDGDSYEFVSFAGDALARMSYGFEVADAPDNFEPEFLIQSWRFSYHLIGDGEDDADEQGVVIDRWRGTLQKVELAADGSHTYTQLGSFKNAKELAMLLDGNGAFGIYAQDGR